MKTSFVYAVSAFLCGATLAFVALLISGAFVPHGDGGSNLPAPVIYALIYLAPVFLLAGLIGGIRYGAKNVGQPINKNILALLLTPPILLIAAIIYTSR